MRRLTEIEMKRVQLLLAAMLLLFLAAGCSLTKSEEESAYHVYYLNKEKTKIVNEEYEPKGVSAEQLIDEYIALLSKNSENIEYRKLLSDDVKVMAYSFDGRQLSLYFNLEYTQMEPAEEVLTRAAIVRTLLQVPEVTCLSFYIEDAPLMDSNGNVIGLMTNESFVENPGEQINAIQTAELRLYFSNEAGDGLIVNTHEVQYISNISMEKLVMEQLLEGPTEEGMQSAIPPGTKLVSVMTTNGICYVNLDEGFLSQKYEILEPIVIYSIVNSLAELPTVSKVQMSVNGDTSIIYRDSYSLEVLYERNLDYVVNAEETTEEGETALE